MQDATRACLFLGVCVPLRLGMAYLPIVLARSYLQTYGAVTAAMATGTLYLALTEGRMQAPEGGGVTWWAPYRLLHGMLLLTAAIYLLRKDRAASAALLLDAMLGALLFFTVRAGINQ